MESHESKSHIFQVKTEKVGILENFKSEYEMEAFLKTHPLLLGYSKSDEITDLVQQFTVRMEKRKGRLDLGVLIPGGKGGYVFKIFELKNTEVKEAHVEQLIGYLENWGKDEKDRDIIYRQFEKHLGKKDIEEQIIKKIPEGVLVGPAFAPEAISKAIENRAKMLKISCIRLSRFGTIEPYVLKEDQIGDLIKRSARKQILWSESGIKPGDTLFIKTNDNGNKIKIFAKPDLEDKLILDNESRKILLQKETNILDNIKKIDENTRNLVLRDLKQLSDKPIFGITALTRLVYFAFNDRKLKNYWVPRYHWQKVN